MKTSSRNAYPGKITAVIPGNLSDEVEISLESGEKAASDRISSNGHSSVSQSSAKEKKTFGSCQKSRSFLSESVQP